MDIPENLRLTRQERLQKIAQQEQWDIIIIGGGITGAGILKQAAQLGLKALLLEQKDFAWGSSSRSSKMVHGGLRYIAQGQFKLTRESVNERQRLLNEAPSLISNQSFAISHYKNQFPAPWIFNCLLSVYDFLAGKKQHKYFPKADYQYLVPNMGCDNPPTHSHVLGGTQFHDAMTDDARLVLRLIQEAQQLGAHAVNYMKVEQLIKDNSQVCGVVAQDTHSTENLKQTDNSEYTDLPLKLKAKVVINATGAWAKKLLVKHNPHEQINLRPLRGSHIIVASWRLPVASAISVLHPEDKRPVQIFPWQNVTIIGTTDIEHDDSLSQEAMISRSEFDYLLAAVRHQFPSAEIREEDVISSFSGVRPVVTNQPVLSSQIKGKVAPSKEKREHSFWQHPGLLTIAGGKLTTFRLIAQQALQKIASEVSLPVHKITEMTEPVFNKITKRNNSELPNHIFSHLQGCYGTLSDQFIQDAKPQTLSPISYSKSLWASLSWAVKYEQVAHLDDLLLRRTRLGNVLPNGGLDLIDKIKQICSNDIQWDDKRWQMEILRYRQIWKSSYNAIPFNNNVSD